MESKLFSLHASTLGADNELYFQQLTFSEPVRVLQFRAECVKEYVCNNIRQNSYQSVVMRVQQLVHHQNDIGMSGEKCETGDLEHRLTRLCFRETKF